MISAATITAREALDIVSGIAGVRREPRLLPAAGRARRRRRWSGRAFRARGSKPPVCREMVRTLLHGHRYDGSRATRELGLAYTPVAETFRRTIEWARAEGLVRPLPEPQYAVLLPRLGLRSLRTKEEPWQPCAVPTPRMARR